MNPFYMGLYIPIFFAAIFKKEVKWKPIEHTVNTEINEEQYNKAIVEAVITDKPNNEDVAKQLNAEFIKKD